MVLSIICSMFYALCFLYCDRNLLLYVRKIVFHDCVENFFFILDLGSFWFFFYFYYY